MNLPTLQLLKNLKLTEEDSNGFLCAAKIARSKIYKFISLWGSQFSYQRYCSIQNDKKNKIK